MKRGAFRFRPTFLAFVSFLAAVSIVNANDLDELRLRKRVVIIYAPDGSEKQLAQQEQLLRSHQAELEERDVTQLVLRTPLDNSEVAARFKLAGSGFTLLLIGKDGDEKLRSHEIVSPERVCRLIDSMPMRQEEIRERAGETKK
jgi:hypothetical protein